MLVTLLVSLIIIAFIFFVRHTIKSDTDDNSKESSQKYSQNSSKNSSKESSQKYSQNSSKNSSKESQKFQSTSYQSDDVVADAFIAVVKLTPDLHVLGDGVKERMKEYAYNTLKKIDGPAGTGRAYQFVKRINQREQIKVKELQKKVSDKLKKHDFQYKKEILICLWALAYADGQATRDQQKLISIIGKALGLSYATCNKIETMFWQRMKAGKFGDYKEFEKRRNKWFEDEAERKAEKEFEKKRKENSNTNYSNSRKTNHSNLSPELQKAYSVLGIDPSASIDEIKNQKKKLLKRYHPDLFANQGEDMIKKATKKAQSINHAYEIIIRNL